MTPSEFAELARLPHAEAIAWMARRQRRTLTYDYLALARGEHARQFTVSRLARLDLLADVHRAIEQSVGGDLSRRDFVRDVRAVLARAGWWGVLEVVDPQTGEVLQTRFDNRRLRLIYDTNVRQAHAAGQWARIERGKASHPYLRYITQRDERVRAEHRAWDNLVLPVDHAFWQTHLPPNGWRCRCRVVAMTQAELDAGSAPSQSGGGYQYDPKTGQVLRDASGQPIYRAPQRIPFKTDAPPIETRWHENRRTGEVRLVPVGIDPGFEHNPGLPGTPALDELVRQKLDSAPTALAQAARADGLGVAPDEAAAASETGLPARLRPMARTIGGDSTDETIIQLAHVDTEYVDGVREVLTRFATQNRSGWLPHGVRAVDVVHEPNLIAATDHRGYFVLGASPLDVLGGRSGLDVMTTALTRIKNGQPLDFYEEYGIESLWHEVLHNSQQHRQPEDAARGVIRVAEGLHQALARQSYPLLLAALGTRARHQAAIRSNGPAYPRATASYYALLEQIRLLDADGAMLPVVEAALREIMFSTRYDLLAPTLVERLSKLSGVPAKQLRVLLERIENGEWLD